MNYYLDPDFELDGKKSVLDEYIENFKYSRIRTY